MRITKKGKRRVKMDEEEETKEDVPDSNIKKLSSMMENLTTGGNLKMISGKEIYKKFKI